MVIMDTIQVSKNQFQMITILLKFLASEEKLDLNQDLFLVNIFELKKFLLRKVILPIEVKAFLTKNFDSIINSFNNLNHKLFTINETNSELVITQSQICLILKPIITNSVFNPIEIQKINEFFRKFSCSANKNEFFLELI